MNDNPLLYAKHADMQRRDAEYLLKKYSDFLKIPKNARVADIGPADGSLTTKILLPKLPPDFEKLTGFDISKEMINFAKKTYQDQPKLEFIELEIASKQIPERFYNCFDNIFSFYCLNWVTENRYVTKY